MVIQNRLAGHQIHLFHKEAILDTLHDLFLENKPHTNYFSREKSITSIDTQLP